MAAESESTEEGPSGGEQEYVPPDEPDIEYLLGHLEELEGTVDTQSEREQVRKTMRIARRIPGGDVLEKRIQKYTTRDMAEAFVGSILLSLPLLVEDGVFDIATWFLTTTVTGIPVFLVGNISFVVLLTIGLIYWADIREVHISNPVFGVIPRRLIGVLGVSFLTVVFLVFLWGRHAEMGHGALGVFSSITVVWAAGATGAALGDILPGESRGHDITVDNLDNIVGSDGKAEQTDGNAEGTDGGTDRTAENAEHNDK